MKYQTKVLVKEAMQSTGKNGKAVCEWANSPDVRFERRGPEGLEFVDVEQNRVVTPAKPGDWIVANTHGGFTVCPNEDFQAHYEPYVEPIPAQEPQAPENGPSNSSVKEAGATAPGENSEE